mgnify:CR=1 FL=1
MSVGAEESCTHFLKKPLRLFIDDEFSEADPPPMSWSNLIVSRGGSRDGNQETQTGRDRYEAAPG